MKFATALFSVGLTTAIASALPTNPMVTWSVSTDGGSSWSNAAIINGAGTVTVRAQLSWTENGVTPAGIGAAVCSFDGTLLGLDAIDNVSNIAKRLVPVNDNQIIVFSRSGSSGKVDVNTDNSAAGAGTGWVTTGQGTQQGIGGAFNPANPITVLTYDLSVGGAAHDVSIGCIMNSTANSAVRVYLTSAGGTSGGGQFSSSAVNISGARVSLVVPAPSSLALCGLVSLASVRRRR